MWPEDPENFDTDVDPRLSGFPLVPDRYHLNHVARTAQGNGYWITSQLATENGTTRDFVAAYIFDPQGNFISGEVIDLGLRSEKDRLSSRDVVDRLKRKIDVRDRSTIQVKPFSISFFGQEFGLIIRQPEGAENDIGDVVIDAMPGFTLMFYGPWTLCNYDS